MAAAVSMALSAYAMSSDLTVAASSSSDMVVALVMAQRADATKLCTSSSIYRLLRLIVEALLALGRFVTEMSMEFQVLLHWWVLTSRSDQ